MRRAVICGVLGGLLGGAALLALLRALDPELFAAGLAWLLALVALSSLIAALVAANFHPKSETLAGATESPAVALPTSPVPTRSPTPARSPVSRPRIKAARIDSHFQWLSASPRLVRFLGQPWAELKSRSLLELIHPEDVPLLDQAIQKSLTDPSPVLVVVRWLISPDPRLNKAAPQEPAPAQYRAEAGADTSELPAFDARQRRYLRMRIQPRRDEKGRLQHYRLRLWDVTHQAKMEKTLRRRTVQFSLLEDKFKAVSKDLDRLKESYRDLYHNAPVMYFSLDEQGRLVTLNDTLLRTLGYAREELLGQPYTALLAASHNGREASNGNSGLLRRDGEVETRWRNKNAAALDVWIRSLPVLDEQGNFIRSRSVALDMTERNRLAQALRTHGDELERTNERLRAINAELEDFTYVVSHDLKEPLRTLQAFSSILAEDFSTQLGPDGFEYINHLNQASRRLGVLIDELLTLSQAGRASRQPEAFNMNETVAVVRRDLVDLLQRKEATVLTEGKLPTVIGDPQRIAQLLTNLVANGLKYNQNPAPMVVIGQMDPEANLPGGARVEAGQAVIFVRDNGIGIDPKFHQQIFGIFRRLHTKEQYEGTGAGLAICKKIVSGHGGQIWVDSRLGHGATFYFSLPLLSSPSSTPAVPGKRTQQTQGSVPSRALPAADVPADGAGASRQAVILLVEDLPEFALVIRRLGQRAGLNVTWFPTAEQAWDWLQGANAPNLLLLDINLPGMSGVDLCRKVRGELPRLTAPIVIFSQEQSLESVEQLHACGADHVLSKDLLCQPAMWEKRLREILRSGPRALDVVY